ncbi:hypothetical protein LXA43DRAFT_573898 [Ganoderma leucocontextum]|nr:hypothetical protein LXA43DRAFT_573898 [Ganoderma leucocontextum]
MKRELFPKVSVVKRYTAEEEGVSASEVNFNKTVGDQICEFGIERTPDEALRLTCKCIKGDHHAKACWRQTRQTDEEEKRLTKSQACANLLKETKCISYSKSAGETCGYSEIQKPAMRVCEKDRAKDRVDGTADGGGGGTSWMGIGTMSLEGGALQAGVNFPEGISYEYRRSSSVGQAPSTYGSKRGDGRGLGGAGRDNGKGGGVGTRRVRGETTRSTVGTGRQATRYPTCAATTLLLSAHFPRYIEVLRTITFYMASHSPLSTHLHV